MVNECLEEDWLSYVCPVVTMEVRMVKVLLHRLLKVPLHDLRLTYLSSKVRDGCCCRWESAVTPPTSSHWAGVFAGFKKGVPPGQRYEDSALLLCRGWRSGRGPLALTHQRTVWIWTIWTQNHKTSLRKTSLDFSGLVLRLGSFRVQQNIMKLRSMSVFEKNAFSNVFSKTENQIDWFKTFSLK